MRVLLIATNQHHRLMSRMDARPLPIGLAYVAGSIDRSRHSLKVLDLMFSEEPLVDVKQVVQEFQPDVVGLSIRNLSNHSYLDPQWALPASKAVIQQVREVSGATIVCGGPAVSLLAGGVFPVPGARPGPGGRRGRGLLRVWLTGWNRKGPLPERAPREPAPVSRRWRAWFTGMGMRWCLPAPGVRPAFRHRPGWKT